MNGAERADGWDKIEKLLINWWIHQNTADVLSTTQTNTSGVNNEAAMITNPKHNPVATTNPGKTDHCHGDSDDSSLTTHQPQPAPNPYYSPVQGQWPIQHPEQYANNSRAALVVNQGGYRDSIHQQPLINNFPRSPEKNSAQLNHAQNQQYMQPSWKDEPVTQLAPPSWSLKSQPIFSNYRDQNGVLPPEKKYPISTGTSDTVTNKLYINQQPHKMPHSYAPHLQQPTHQQHANLNHTPPHLQPRANFEQSYYVTEPMAQLRIESSNTNNQPTQQGLHYNEHGYGYEYSPFEADDAHHQPQSVVNSERGAVMRQY